MCVHVGFQEHAQNLPLITPFFSHLGLFLMCMRARVCMCERETLHVQRRQLQ